MGKMYEPKTRRIDGETYDWVQGAQTKDRAQSVASTIRRSGADFKGPKVRVIPGKFHKYNIYKSRKNRKTSVLKHHSEKRTKKRRRK